MDGDGPGPEKLGKGLKETDRRREIESEAETDRYRIGDVTCNTSLAMEIRLLRETIWPFVDIRSFICHSPGGDSSK